MLTWTFTTGSPPIVMPVESLVIGLVVAVATSEPQIVESDPLPEIELLEFLGSWETASGEWVDPTVWADEPEVPAEPLEEEKHE